MGKYDNMKVFERGLNVFVEQKVKPHLTVILAEVAQDVVDYIDQISSEKKADGLPILTGALHDASGVGVYRDGILAAYRPRQIYNTQEASGQMFSPEDMFDYASKPENLVYVFPAHHNLAETRATIAALFMKEPS